MPIHIITLTIIFIILLITFLPIIYLITYKTPNVCGECNDCGGCGYCIKTEEDIDMTEILMKCAEDFARKTYGLSDAYELHAFSVTPSKVNLEYRNTVVILKLALPRTLIDDLLATDTSYNKEEN